MRERERNTNKN